MSSRTISNCQSCGSSDLILRFSAGFLPCVNSMSPIGQRLNGQNFYPAELLECQECKLVQLGCIVDQEEVFPPDYAYTSGSTRLLRENFKQLAEETKQYLEDGDLVVDIGSNDGTLLLAFQKEFGDSIHLLGIEPTNQGKSAPVPTIVDFFSLEMAEAILNKDGWLNQTRRELKFLGKQAKLITCCNCFAHMPDINGVMEGINHLLADDGVFIIEVQYLPKTLEKVQYDCIYHEHQFYYSLTSLRNLLTRHGFVIQYVKEIPTHGGSMRVIARKKLQSIEPQKVFEWCENEKERIGFFNWVDFKNNAVWSKLDFWKLSHDMDVPEEREDVRIYGIGAPSRATTYLHYVGLDESILDCVCEIKGSNKIGKYIPGTAIPVVDEEKLYQDQPEYALLLSWHLADELIPKIREKGFKGRFIVPLPEVKVIE